MTPSTDSFSWEQVFNAIGHPSLILDQDHKIIAANDASIAVTGLASNKIIGRYCFQVFHGHNETEPPNGCPMQKMLQSGKLESTDMEMEALAGTYMVSCTPILDANGSLDKVIHIATDITERKRAEKILLEQKLFTESMIHNSSIATFAIDNKHTVVIWNKACEVLTGFSSDTILKTDLQHQAFYRDTHPTLADVVLDGDISKLPELYTHVVPLEHNPKGLKAEGWFANVGGKDRYLLVEAAPVLGLNGEIVTVIETLHDLTESKTMEEQLIHAQKMESIGHLAGGVAHEFNNILAVILGYGQMMRKGLQADSKTIADLDQIMAAGERAAALTKGMLTFSRKQHIFRKKLDLNQLVHNTFKSISRIIGAHITSLENLSEMGLQINADKTLIVQLLMNLITNSRDAMQDGGFIEVATEQIVVKSPVVTPHCTIQPGEYAKLSVSDTGHGIDDEMLHKIFEPFFTTKDVGKGTGLGLAVAHSIVQQHDGYFTVTSKKDAGTTFNIYLPLLEGDRVSQEKSVTARSIPGGNETILLADDEPVIVELIKDILSDIGYTVISAVDGIDAVEKFMTHQDKIDLLVFDVQMGRMSGLQAFRKIRKINNNIKVLFVSGFNAEQFAAENELEPGTELLSKPFKPFDIAQKIRNLLEV